jgi:arylsulfatase A-like enzyme
LIDFAPTFLDIAGIKAPADMQGRSILPLCQGEKADQWRTSLYYHYYEFPEPHRVRPHVGVITDRFKLVHYYKPDVDTWELLDRIKDPLETKNFYDDPAYAQTVQELHQELERLKVAVDETDEPPRTAYGNLPFDGESK